MNIRAFVRGSNAVVNKKSHELHYTPIHETTIPPVGSSDRCVLCSVYFARVYARVFARTSIFTCVVSDLHDRSAKSKEIEGGGEAKRREKVKATRFVSFFYVVVVVVVVVIQSNLFIYFQLPRDSLDFDR